MAADDHNTGTGRCRTDMHCHNCSKGFIAQLDYGLDGNHVVACPHCGHQHCRTIKGGKVTEARWSSRNGRRHDNDIQVTSVWKSDSLPATTSTAAAFIRDSWLNKSDLNL